MYRLLTTEAGRDALRRDIPAVILALVAVTWRSEGFFVFEALGFVAIWWGLGALEHHLGEEDNAPRDSRDWCIHCGTESYGRVNHGSGCPWYRKSATASSYFPPETPPEPGPASDPGVGPFFGPGE